MNPSMSQNRRLIAVSAIVTFGVGILNNIGSAKEDDLANGRFLLGLGVTFTIISIIADLGSPLGGAFAVLVMIVAILTQGRNVLKYIGKRSKEFNRRENKRKAKKRG